MARSKAKTLKAHPDHYASSKGGSPAMIMAESGEEMSFGLLERRANQAARLMRERGLKRGDVIALYMENGFSMMEVAWGAQRAGLYYTAISTRLTAEEAAYIVNDCDARLLFISGSMSVEAEKTRDLTGKLEGRFSADGEADGFELYEERRDEREGTLLEDPSSGGDMLYSSGTTGRPKGVRRPLSKLPYDEQRLDAVALLRLSYGFDEGTRYLCPAPLYHAAPLRFVMGVQRLGGCAVVMKKFDAIGSLAHIEKYGITHSQWTPTMFVRILKAPEEETRGFDLSSHRTAIHAAAPCPVHVKRRMMDWWGPILHEYYGGTEGNGMCVIGPEEWLRKPGSVGRSLTGELHICDEAGDEVATGEEGLVYFETSSPYAYHKDEEKTMAARNPKTAEWTTLGDIGRMDEEGYLFLTDRKAFTIVSGGVNVYPQEVEDVLLEHEAVADAAVFGVPDDDFGEAVKAVVEPVKGMAGSEELAEELRAFMKGRLSGVKVPKSVDFMESLPRSPTGKLYKRLLRDEYWKGRDSRIA